MIKVLTPTQMRVMENEYFASGMSSGVQLMGKAADRVFVWLLQKFGELKGMKINIACGIGNNGGDGWALALLVAKAGATVSIITLCDFGQLTDTAELYAEQVLNTNGITIYDATKLHDVPVPDVWVDAIFGIGLNREPKGDALDVINTINAHHDSGAFTLAVDVPSGLCALTGKILASCIMADCTITFQTSKIGHYLYDGKDVCGELVVADIGIPENFLPQNYLSVVELTDLKTKLKKRKHNSYKGTYGHVLVIAGSYGMAGAAILCAKAALRAGAGLVTVACPYSVVSIIQSVLPCAMVVPLNEEDGAISKTSVKTLKNALINKTAIAIGPGLTRRVPEGIIQLVLDSGIPAVIDADALNLISQNPELKNSLRTHHVLTPHEGELKRLLGVLTNPLEDSLKLASHGCTALIKGVTTTITSGDATAFSSFGSPGMATGGSGDVLTGIIAACLAGGDTPFDAALLGAALHGLAGEACAKKLSETSMTAMDMVDSLPDVFSQFGL